MNGTTLGSSAVSNGAMGTEWSVLGTGDFNQDGRPDVLWENAAGTVDIWEMNGANPVGLRPECGNGAGRFAGVGHFSGYVPCRRACLQLKAGTHGELVITPRSASGTDRGNAAAKRARARRCRR
jgi:hypothetical protein